MEPDWTLECDIQPHSCVFCGKGPRMASYAPMVAVECCIRGPLMFSESGAIVLWNLIRMAGNPLDPENPDAP